MRASRVQSRAIVLGAIALVVVPVGVAEFPREVSRWHHAAALNAWLDSDPSQAFTNLDRALDWNPRGVDLLLQRADWQIQRGQYEAAIVDCDLAGKIDPSSLQALRTRTIGLQFLGRHREAVDDWNVIDKRNRGRMPTHRLLNGRAYARALGKLELDEGLEDANESLTRLRRLQRQRKMWLPESMLVAPAGYFQATLGIDDYYRHGGSASAIRHLNRAEASVRTVFEPLDEAWRKLEADGEDPGQVGAQRHAAAALLAAILYVQSEAHASEGSKAAADADRTASESLDPKLDRAGIRKHSLRLAINMAQENANVLDTRGLIYLRRGQVRQAFQDMMIAVELAEQLTQVFARQFKSNAFFLDEDYRAAQTELATMKHTMAVIYFHRAQVYLSIGQSGKARSDLSRVKSLGFEPGERLF